MESQECPLCLSQTVADHFYDDKREWPYFKCHNCELVFRDPKTYLSSSEEKSRYETHNNSIENRGYVKFLSPCVEMLLPHVTKDHIGLDYGSGPGPIIDQLFKPHDISVVNYDPYFNFDEGALEKQYDFVTCTEVFEHMYSPSKDLLKIKKLIKPNGLLLLMTEMYPDKHKFPTWGYRMDNTHVLFMSPKSLDWICESMKFELIDSSRRIMLLRNLV